MDDHEEQVINNSHFMARQEIQQLRTSLDAKDAVIEKLNNEIDRLVQEVINVKSQVNEYKKRLMRMGYNNV